MAKTQADGATPETGKARAKPASQKAFKRGEKRVVHRVCPSGVLQQHGHHDYRCRRQRDRLVQHKRRGFKGSRKGTPFAATQAACRRATWPRHAAAVAGSADQGRAPT